MEVTIEQWRHWIVWYSQPALKEKFKRATINLWHGVLGGAVWVAVFVDPLLILAGEVETNPGWGRGKQGFLDTTCSSR